MAKNPSQPKRVLSAQTQVEQELLHAVLMDEAVYPWQPAQADAYYQQVAAAGEALEWFDEEVTQGWQTFSTQLNGVWGHSAGALQAALAQKFAGRLSVGLIDQISDMAQQMIHSGRPLAEQLIACVRDTLTGWDDGDLQVMARPLAYAMRGQTDILDVTIASVRNTDWDALSPMEQARLSLAAARYAIDYLKATEDDA
jgi:hypothetical protein